MPSNRSILGVLAQVDGAAIQVHQDRCAKVRNRNVACLKCAEACTSGCIALVDDRLTVDASKCVGCGTCATVCPTCALEARNPTDAQLLEECLAARQDDEVVITCELVRRALAGLVDEGSVATTVCLGRVDESLVCALAARGVAHVTLACGQCSQCAQRLGASTARMVAASANDLLDAWGCEARVTVAEGAPARALAAGVDPGAACEALAAYFEQPRGNEPIRATELSEECGGGAATLEADADGGEAPAAADLPAFAFAPRQHAPKPEAALVRVMKDGTLPHFVPDRRERLLDCLAQLGDPHVGSLSSRLWGCVVIDGRACSSCRMCATFCPTGAIRKFDNEDGTMGVEHVPGDCVKCGSCRDVCPEGAIRLLDEVRPEYLLDGAKHRYTMTPRPVELGTAQQMVETMRLRMQGTDIFER